jgi:DNA helicase-2/ATP-dependent DNA helicase PcrA
MPVENTLNDQQKAAVQYSGEAQNLLVIAGAGCGKTRTITSRAAHLINTGTDPSRILLVTFTNRAANEMKNRLKAEVGSVSKKVQAGTFHSFCLKIMRQVPNSFEIHGLNIIDSDDQISLMGLIRSRFLNKLEKNIRKVFPKPFELVKYYSYCRNVCQDPWDYLETHTELSEDYIKLCTAVFSEYQIAKETKGYLDFDDLLVRFGNVLSRKGKLRKQVAKLYDECLVDEMQDTNPSQFKILKQFAKEGVRLFCVGDPAQSIYGFRGAKFEQIYSFDKFFPGSKKLPLSINYRSYQEILDLSNWLLNRSPFNFNGNLKAKREKYGYNPELHDFDSNYDEASWIADKIIERTENDTDYRDIMILVRTAYDAKSIEAELIQREIPYYFIGGTSLTKSAHVRDVLALLRIVRNSQDDLAWMRYLQLWPRVGPKTAEKVIHSFNESVIQAQIQILTELLGQGHRCISAYEMVRIGDNSLNDYVQKAVQSLSPIIKSKYDKWDYRKQDLQLLVKVSERYQDLSDFIDAFTLEPMTSTEIKKLENDDAVALITVHSAKGTEAKICFVVNAKQGTYPHSRSYGDIDSEEEERRVLYVALTRAKNELYITRSTEYRSGFYVENKPTKGEEYFLAEVPDDLVLHEINGWKTSVSAGISSLKDIY